MDPIVVLRGEPTPDELAALAAVLLAVIPADGLHAVPRCGCSRS